ncbi:hypothetical protein SCHPADRAFT_932437 [Schizopora paradoxa]|uniref:F-box domain-containing protein n=1 Tax=Schizopora paradoxa TaxID=27342 RepID=A0A0H2R6M0_9AGAM|nr:hypothetical protein SCHPADRAFT_932437 [Schizopora paradoxa]
MEHLPDDLLELIFWHASPAKYSTSPIEFIMEGDDELIASPEAKSKLDINRVSPMNFSLVRRAWRDLVLSRGYLWSALEIHLESLNESKILLSAALRMLRIWIRNSLDAPLDVEASGFVLSEDLTPQSEICRILFNLLLGEQHRWNNVSLTVVYHRPWDEDITINAKSLKSLCMNLDVGPRWPLIPVTLHFSVCSQLESLDVYYGVKLVLDMPQNLLLENLKILRLNIGTGNNSDIPSIRKLLLASPNLCILDVGANISRDRADGPLFATGNPLHLSSLTELTILNEHRTLVLDLIGWLRCPNLSYFNIREPNYFNEQVSKDMLLGILSFLSRSRPPLRHLILSGMPWTVERFQGSREECAQLLRNILNPLSGLEVLKLKDVVVDDCLLEEMTFCEGRGDVVCPRLKDFMFSSSQVSLDPQKLADMYTSRRGRRDKLRHFYLCLPKNYDKLEDLRVKLKGTEGYGEEVSLTTRTL